MLGRLAPRLFGRRPFSKYISETYGNKQHRLARKPGIEVEPTEVIIYFFGAAILASDVSSNETQWKSLKRIVQIYRDQRYHRAIYEQAGSPEEVWNQQIWLEPRKLSTISHSLGQRGGL